MSYKITSKKFLSFIMAILIALSVLIVQAGAKDVVGNGSLIQAANSEEISPLWENVSTATLNIDFSNKKIGANITIRALKGTKYKNGTVTISKYSGSKYVPIKKWTGLSSSNSFFLFSNSELSAISGVKYKLSISITAYTSSKSEVINTSKVATCP